MIKVDKSRKNQDTTANQGKRLEITEKYQLIIIVIAFVAVCISAVLIIWTKNALALFLILIYFIVFCFERVLNTSDIILEMVFGNNKGNSRITPKNFFHILCFCSGLLSLLISPLGTMQTYSNLIINTEWNVYVKSALISLLIFINVFCLFFIGIISLALPIKQIENIIKRIAKNTPEEKKAFLSNFHNKVIGAILINEIIKNNQLWKKILLIILLPIVFICLFRLNGTANPR